MKSMEGEIVEVQGGHIVRSTGRKDRHSKVFTSKGARDRRVRLSAHTAIQFYDVQDRLGYDRPSKAVDWLINKAKSSIDKLAELPPPWLPYITNNNAAAAVAVAASMEDDDEYSSFQIHRQQHHQNSNNDSSFMPPPQPMTTTTTTLDTDAIAADTMKSFFPTSTNTASSSLNFQNYPSDIITRTTNNPIQDLGLSLHILQDKSHHSHAAASSADHHHHQALFAAGSAPAAVGLFDSNFQRMVASWNHDEMSTESRGGGGFLFNSSSSLSTDEAAMAAFSQRGPLQSSFTQAVRAWDEIPNGKSSNNEIQHSDSIFGMPTGFKHSSSNSWRRSS